MSMASPPLAAIGMAGPGCYRELPSVQRREATRFAGFEQNHEMGSNRTMR
jgi:hypothetical protein